MTQHPSQPPSATRPSASAVKAKMHPQPATVKADSTRGPDKLWFSVPQAAITGPAPCGVDDTTSLRPVWHGNVAVQCKTMCWIASGDSTCVASATGAGSATALGRMYTGGSISCDASGGQYSEFDVPTVGKQVWSFDKMSWSRAGSFSAYTCKW